MTHIRHVLFDADGVLQYLPGGWHAAVEPHLGDRADDFLRRAWQDELPSLAGQGDYLPLLAAALAEYGVATPAEAFYEDVWHRIAVVDETFAIVDALRRSGYGVHLGTNQGQLRAAHMRTALGYDARFDVSCYSCELGVAKPEPAFFTEAARRIGAPPQAVLFIDDSAGNTDAARAAGLAAEQWDHTQGHPVLLDLLAGHGVDLRGVDLPSLRS